MAPIWGLCARGDLKGLKAALAMGEDVNAGDENNMTGLMFALYSGNNPIVEVLLQQPSLDLTSSDNCGLGNGQTAVHWACYNDNVTGLRMLLAHPRQTSVNTKDPQGWTPLMCAVLCGSVECVKELVSIEGLDLMTTDYEGDSVEEEAR